MRLHHISLVLISLIVIGVTQDITGQQVILNTKGERIIIYPDGSWRHFEQKDSSLLHTSSRKEDVLPEIDLTAETAGMNAQDMQELIRVSEQFAQSMRTEALQAQRALSKATDEKFRVGGRLQQATDNKQFMEPDMIANLEDEYVAKTDRVKQAKKRHKVLTKIAERAVGVLAVPLAKRAKALNKVMVAYNAFNATETADRIVEASKSPPKVPKEKAPRVRPEKKTKPKERERTRDKRMAKGAETRGDKTKPVKPAVAKASKSNVKDKSRPAKNRTAKHPVPKARTVTTTYQRQPLKCKYAWREVSGSSSIQVALESAHIFSHTDEELRQYFREQELITCTGYLSRLEERIYLTVNFSISSPNARKNFGVLEGGSMLRLNLLNGTYVNLYNAKIDRGRIDPYTGNTLFTGNYIIDKEAEKAVTRSELDTIRVVWGTGFEDYEVYELDFLIDQFSCIRSLQ